MATKLKNLRISKVDFVDEGANPDAHIKLTKSKGEKGQSTGENGDKNGFVSRLFGFIGKKAGMNQEEIDSAVEERLTFRLMYILSQHLDHQHSCASRFPRFRRKELESGLES